MRLLFGPFVLLLVLSSAQPSATQQTTATSVQRDPQAIQLLAHALSLSLSAQVPQISDAVIQGTLSNPGASGQGVGTFVAKARGFDLSVEISAGDDTSSYKVLHGFGTSLINGIKTPLPWHATAGLTLDLIPTLARWTEFTNVGHSVRYLGQTEINGKACQSVEVEAPYDSDARKRNELGKVDVFIDPGSSLIYSIQYKTSPFNFSSQQVLIETRYSDYQNVNGILVPMTVEKLADGQSTRIFHITSVQFNVALADSEFKN